MIGLLTTNLQRWHRCCAGEFIHNFVLCRYGSFVSEGESPRHLLSETDATKIDRGLVRIHQTFLSETAKGDGEVACLRSHVNAAMDVLVQLENQSHMKQAHHIQDMYIHVH